MLLAFVTVGLATAQDQPLSAETNRAVLSKQFAVTPTNFIQFVRTPPVIDTLIYKRILFNKRRVFRTKAEADKFIRDYKTGSRSGDKLEELFALRYLSPDHLVFKHVSSVANPWLNTDRIGVFFGCGDGMWWMLTPTGAMTTDSTNGIYKLGGEDLMAFVANQKFATEVLRLGMYDLLPDTIAGHEKPNPNSGEVGFTARSIDGETINGHATVTGGLVSRIAYTILNAGGRINGRIIDVTHEDGVLKSIQVSNLMTGRPSPTLHSYYEVLSLTMPTSYLSTSSCVVDQFLTASDRKVLTKANGESFYFSGKELKPIAAVTHTAVQSSQHRRAVVLGLLVTLSASLAFWAFRRRKNRLSESAFSLRQQVPNKHT